MAIHQPQYIPWLPYFLKVAESDVFVLLDSVEFQKNGLQNRNQLKTAAGPLWLTVPVKQKLGQRICDVVIDAGSDWRRKHWLTIQQNYRRAPAFERYADELAGLLAREWTSLNDLNIEMFRTMMRWLGIDRPVRRSSEMQSRGQGSELIVNLCREAGATTYVSGAGGRAYLDEAAFTQAGVELVYREPVVPAPYPQQHPATGFAAGLSALDIILNCGPEWRTFLPAGGVA